MHTTKRRRILTVVVEVDQDEEGDGGFIEGDCGWPMFKRRRMATSPTVETFARAQDFDGSFSLSTVSKFPNTISPVIPLSLSLLVSASNQLATSAEPTSIWSTILTVTTRARSSMVWSMMKETEYISDIFVTEGRCGRRLGRVHQWVVRKG